MIVDRFAESKTAVALKMPVPALQSHVKDGNDEVGDQAETIEKTMRLAIRDGGACCTIDIIGFYRRRCGSRASRITRLFLKSGRKVVKTDGLRYSHYKLSE